MKRNTWSLLVTLLILLIFSQNLVFALPVEEIYLDIRLTRPLVEKDFINLKSGNGFLLFEKGNEDRLKLIIEDRYIKATTNKNGSVDLIDENYNIIFTLPNDGSILISSGDIENSIIMVEKDRYRDFLKLINKNNEIIAINHVNLENYLYGVVPREMGYNSPIEALKAQAVASRSFALSSTKHRSQGYDLCDTTDCQAYLGYDGEHPTTNAVVDETKGVLALYEGEVIQAMYHSTSSGMTEDSANAWGGNLPYLKSVVDEFSTDFPYSNWKLTIGLSDLNNRLMAEEINIGNLNNIKILETTETGNVTRLILQGTKGEEIISGLRFRSIVGGVSLKSTWFTLNDENKGTTSNLVYVIDETSFTPQIINLDDAYVLDGTNQQRPTRSSRSRVLGRDTEEGLNQSMPISTSEITIHGRGYGHGVGMSQNGAKKMAELGYSYDEILMFYYTGIEVF